MTPDPDIAAALGRIPSGLFVLTCRRESVEVAMLASWVQQCSFDPPQITFAVKEGRDVAGWLSPDAPFAVNILAEGQNAIVAHFAQGKPLSELPIDESPVERGDNLAPALTKAHAVLHCRVVADVPAGDHRLFIGRIVGGRVHTDTKPWVHIRKSGMKY